MMVMSRVMIAAAIVVAFAAAPPLEAQGNNKGVSMKLSRELAPPGGIAQVKLLVTEPKPITTGRMVLSFAFDDIEGIAIGEPTAAGMAVDSVGGVALTLSSPTGVLGLAPDYPIVMIAGRVPATATVGTRLPASFGGQIVLVDPTGATYPLHVKDGSVDVGGSLWIGDVQPGSAALAAGDLVSIYGGGFDATSRVKLEETAIAQTAVQSTSRIDVVLGQDAVMHALGVRLRTRTGGEVTYYSYQRTRPSGASSDPLLAATVPLFPAQQHMIASVPIGATTVGLALQNLGGVDTVAGIELINAAGATTATGSIIVPAGMFVVRSGTELVGTALAGTGRLRISTAAPLQVLGVNVDGAGNVTAAFPQ
jgi:hypothetical protein